jgi:acyl dehydratase
MSLESLSGRSYGPVRTTISAAKSYEYVAATGDDPVRWAGSAPPSYAGALLFAVAPRLIADPDVGHQIRVLVHVDQTFRWRGPLVHDTVVGITGTVRRVRERGGVGFVTFDTAVNDGEGTSLVEATSTFLMGATPVAEPGPHREEPPIEEGSRSPVTAPFEPAPGARLPETEVAASRLDLVRYAGASGDFNPIHFDHDAARRAGLDGIVVHGLLMSAWMTRLACAATGGEAPLQEMKVRFRNPLRPAETAVVGGAVGQDGRTLTMALGRAEEDLVTGRVILRMGG